MMRKNSAYMAIYLTCAFLWCGISGCISREDLSTGKYRETQMLMGTIIHVDVCQGVEDTEKGKSAYNEVWRRLEDIAWRMNVLDERSDVSKINQSNIDPVLIGSDTYKVLERSIYYSKITNGAFDITIWPLIKLWKHSEKNSRLPSADEIRDAQKMIGMDNINLINGNMVRRNNTGTKIDLGGIAKGYAVDEVARIFRKYGIADFFIDAGGDLYVGGNNCNGEPWRIGIRDPGNKTTIRAILEINDAAIATSGNYERYFQIAGQQYSHVIDPRSGYPQKEVISSTVIAPTAMEADALATALCVLGADKGLAIIDNMTNEYAGYVIKKNNDRPIDDYWSKSLALYLHKESD